MSSNYFGPYEIIQELGKGGFATTYEARIENSKSVCLKVFAEVDLKTQKSFGAEIDWMLEKHNHPNIVSYY